MSTKFQRKMATKKRSHKSCEKDNATNQWRWRNGNKHLVIEYNEEETEAKAGRQEMGQDRNDDSEIGKEKLQKRNENEKLEMKRYWWIESDKKWWPWPCNEKLVALKKRKMTSKEWRRWTDEEKNPSKKQRWKYGDENMITNNGDRETAKKKQWWMNKDEELSSKKWQWGNGDI